MSFRVATVTMPTRRMWLVFGAALVLMLLLSSPAAAALNNLALLDTVVSKFSAKAIGWQGVMMKAATWLFWTLGTISLAWTGGMMVLRKADMGEFFSEFIRFILFFGFFLWLLRNGPAFAASIIESMQRLGANAAGQASVTPSAIVDIGFSIWQQAVSRISALNPVQSLVGILLSAAILLLLAAVAVNMLLLLVSGWILMYAGIFFLSFGGSRWTSDMAINYYKSVLGVGVQLMTMVLLVGIGNDLLVGYYGEFDRASNNLNEMVVMVVFCLVLLMLATKVPAMVAGMVTGGASGGFGSFGAGAFVGAAMGAAGAAASAAGMAGAAMRSGAASTAGGVPALMAAYGPAAGAGGDAWGRAALTGSVAGASAFADMYPSQSSNHSGGGSGNAGTSQDGKGSIGPGMESRASGDERAESSHSTHPSAPGESPGTGASGGQQAGPSSAGNGSARMPGGGHVEAGGFGRALATAAGTSGYLAQGTLAVGRQRMASLQSQARERTDTSLGARIAAAIECLGAPPSVNRAGGRAQHAEEVAAFVQRDSSQD